MVLRGKYTTKADNIADEGARPIKRRRGAGQKASKFLKRCLGAAKKSGVHHGRSLLDLGCRDGELGNRLAQSQFNYTGIELIDAYVTLASETGINVLKMDACNLKFDDATFDIVVSHHNLEHVWDCDKACHEMYRVLKPNGILVFAAPIGTFQLRGDVIRFFKSLGLIPIWYNLAIEGQRHRKPPNPNYVLSLAAIKTDNSTAITHEISRLYHYRSYEMRYDRAMEELRAASPDYDG